MIEVVVFTKDDSTGETFDHVKSTFIEGPFFCIDAGLGEEEKIVKLPVDRLWRVEETSTWSTQP